MTKQQLMNQDIDATADRLVRLFPKQNGEITWELTWRQAWAKLTIHGGPFRHYVPGPNTVGVNLKAEEQDRRATYWLPIQDFSIPDDDDQVANTLKAVLKAMLDGKDVYVGCMGGWGRTGLFLAILAKVLTDDDSVAFVRRNYTSHAVETSAQKAYVENFDVASIKAWFQREAWKTFLRRKLFFWR